MWRRGLDMSRRKGFKKEEKRREKEKETFARRYLDA